MSTLRGPAQLADLQGALCVPPITSHVASTAGLEPAREITMGFHSRDFSLLLAPVFPSISTRARLVMVPFLWLVCRRAFPAPPRHTGDMRQVVEPFLPPPATLAARGRVFDGWLLPCCRVCVSFNCFSSRVPGSIARRLEVWEWVFEEPHLRLMV